MPGPRPGRPKLDAHRNPMTEALYDARQVKRDTRPHRMTADPPQARGKRTERVVLMLTPSELETLQFAYESSGALERAVFIRSLLYRGLRGQLGDRGLTDQQIDAWLDGVLTRDVTPGPLPSVIPGARPEPPPAPPVQRTGGVPVSPPAFLPPPPVTYGTIPPPPVADDGPWTGPEARFASLRRLHEMQVVNDVPDES